MKIGIVGLGLIGGSLAKAYKSTPGNYVYGYDINKSVLSFAKLAGAIDEDLNESNIKGCDCIFIALYPKDTIEYVREIAPLLQKDNLVIDCCGIKRQVCSECFEIARKNKFTFVGGHPMAGKQCDGFKYSRETLFRDASMIIVPEDYNDIRLLDRIKKILKPIGFRGVTVATPDVHDQMVAFTSQMAHIVSNAYIKSPTAKNHKGFSAGSYNDLTRVAYLNEEMWAELFLDNSDFLIEELDIFVENLQKYQEALKSGNAQNMKALLVEGKECKLEVDGKCR